MDQLSVFAIYYASLASMQFHPGAGTRGHTPLTLEQCAEKACEMVAITRDIFYPQLASEPVLEPTRA